MAADGRRPLVRRPALPHVRLVRLAQQAAVRGSRRGRARPDPPGDHRPRAHRRRARGARDAAPDGLHVIVGQEVRTTTGDLIGLFLERAVPSGMSPAEAAAAHPRAGRPRRRCRIRSTGSVPGAGRKRLGERSSRSSLPLLDYVEIWNARLIVGDGNRRAAAFADDHGLPGVAVSDAHTRDRGGRRLHRSLDGPLDTADRAPRRAAGRSARHRRAARASSGLAMPMAKLVQRMRGNGRVAAGMTDEQQDPADQPPTTPVEAEQRDRLPARPRGERAPPQPLSRRLRDPRTIISIVLPIVAARPRRVRPAGLRPRPADRR